ncbi:Methyltransferase [Glutamicibacter phage Voltaire]|uniref:Methyltransferase n=1 Tax=Glutamicibacter phage Voltaire TaxID=2891955 RepID=UPI002054F6FE|nr:Methyltransferase [Glutamicibacter phage Voltaire]CAH1191427.1 Methyltransferase [Glutamicibacter phage Voltaire]
MKTILQLCADTGSDTWPYRNDPAYEVITIGADIGVENYSPDRPIHGIIANPMCTEFSMARHGHKQPSNPESALWMVQECQRVINEANPVWYAIENPASGTMKKYLGAPNFTYEPWQFGSPWTKRTALWGNFTKPEKTYADWNDVPKLDLYQRPGRGKPSMAFLHKSSFWKIPEFYESGMPAPESDMEMRSICSQKFAAAFKLANP